MRKHLPMPELYAFVFMLQEAALNIKIVVVELAGEHAPNTVWVSR